MHFQHAAWPLAATRAPRQCRAERPAHDSSDASVRRRPVGKVQVRRQAPDAECEEAGSVSDACPQHCGVLLVVTSLDVRVVSKQDLGGGRSVLRRGGRAHVRGTLGVHVIGWAPPGKPRCAERCYHDASERRRQRQRLGRVTTGVKVRKGLLTVSVRRWRPAPRSASRTSVCPCLVAWCTPLHWFESNEPERAGSPARAACTPDRSPDAHFAWKASMSARTKELPALLRTVL